MATRWSGRRVLVAFLRRENYAHTVYCCVGHNAVLNSIYLRKLTDAEFHLIVMFPHVACLRATTTVHRNHLVRTSSKTVRMTSKSDTTPITRDSCHCATHSHSVQRNSFSHYKDIDEHRQLKFETWIKSVDCA